ncbi:MAG TPA: DinB family protein [Gemmatimonadaceae bacterium]|nr:DinB family protein [Gemmatimonadaceae bacterium]
MLNNTLQLLLVRELRACKRQLEAYPDDASAWRPVPGIPNVAGTLALHVAGNIQHFFGAILGHDGYVRDRDSEFARRDVPRQALYTALDAAIASVERTLPGVRDETFAGPYPEPIAKRRVKTQDFVIHLVAHLAYHLGQMDYHRRVVTGDSKGLDAVSVRELPEMA